VTIKFPSNPDANGALTRALERAREAKEFGPADIQRLYEETFRKGKRRVDVADWIGPLKAIYKIFFFIIFKIIRDFSNN
jgi:hypothetical protein